MSEEPDLSCPGQLVGFGYSPRQPAGPARRPRGAAAGIDQESGFPAEMHSPRSVKNSRAPAPGAAAGVQLWAALLGLGGSLAQPAPSTCTKTVPGAGGTRGHVLPGALHPQPTQKGLNGHSLQEEDDACPGGARGCHPESPPRHHGQATPLRGSATLSPASPFSSRSQRA